MYKLDIGRMEMKKVALVLVLLFTSLFMSNTAFASSGTQLIIINKKTNKLAFYDNGALVRTFSVATGRENSLTPEGTFEIVNKIKNRPYYTKNIPGGDPANPLGDRWLGLNARGTYGTTYAIHGNNNANSIGKYVSSGCVRMHNEEVRWLFDQVKLYTKVIITNSNDTFAKIAANSGYFTNGWEQLDGKWYYYVNGVAKTGWQSIGNTWYYFNNNGSMKTGWLLDGGKWYYLNSSGTIKTGWHSEGGQWFYLEPSGVMKTGWYNEAGKWYYLTSSGAMARGWVKDAGHWYYMNSSGVMTTGWIPDGGHWYYLSSSGAMAKGWVKDAGHWYYLNTSGVMEKGWIKDAGSWYYLNSSGAMQTGWINEGDSTYYLASSGAMQTGWKEVDQKWYYFYDNGVKAVNTTIDGYQLGPDGARMGADYLALGDSLAAGQTPYGEDALGYPDYLAEHFSSSYQLIDFDNLGKSGYTSRQLREDVLNNEAVRAEIREASHITIDIGANDIFPLLLTDVTQVGTAIEEVSKNLDTILKTIDELNPTVDVYVMGYYNPIPYYPEDQQAQLYPLLQAFNTKLAEQAHTNGDGFISTESIIASNYQEYLPNQQDVHLSQQGYQAIASEFWRVISGN
ncbi:L,D-transpeptidase family protein [Bacillus sp. BGMRC 2118]|nr:L,D-transpeptidase family protein [Bacillus sp. BGMRC 2118]